MLSDAPFSDALGALTGCSNERRATDAPATRATEAAAPHGEDSGTDSRVGAGAAADAPDAPDAPMLAPDAGLDRELSPPTDWCPYGLPNLTHDACYAETVRGAPRNELLIYLHGLVPSARLSEQKESVHRAVLEATRRRGASAILPRGVRGIGPDVSHDAWAWPTAPASHERHIGAIVRRLIELRGVLERARGARFTRVYLAGSSNAAFFLSAGLLAGDFAHLGLSVDGIAILSGGAPGGRAVSARARTRPIPTYIGFGSRDGHTRGARELATLLRGYAWPLRVRELPLEHGAHAEYLNEAFTFWAAE
jgi:hypothetical protein